MNEVRSGCAVRAAIQDDKLRDQLNEWTERMREVKRHILTLKAENDRLRQANHEAEVVRRTAKFLLEHLPGFDWAAAAIWTPDNEVLGCLHELQREIELEAEHAG